MNKRLVLILLFLLVSANLIFAAEPALEVNDLLLSDVPIIYGDESFRERILERTKGERDPIGLVLSGGSARAFAHLGVLRYLEEEGIEPDFIVSNSMGTLIAMLYAAGLSPDQIESTITAADLSTYFKLTVPLAGGLLEPAEFKSMISNVVGPDTNIEDLPIPVMVIEQDMVTKREIQICEGNFADIYIASFALPVYFPPQEFRGHLLLDGGINSLVPLATAFNYSDTVIASTTFYDNDKLNLRNPITILNVAMDINKTRNAASEFRDYTGQFIWIRCAVEKFSFMDFASASEMAVIGYESAKEKADELSTLYKGGICDGITVNRQIFQKRIDKLNSDLYLFQRIEAFDSTRLLSLGTHSFQSTNAPYYLRDTYDIGLEYTWKYRPIEISALLGTAIDLTSNEYQQSKLLLSGNVNYYPLNRMRISLYTALTFDNNNKDWVIPTIYAREGIDLKIFSDSRFNLELNQAFELFKNPLNNMPAESLLSVQAKGDVEFPITRLNFAVGYLLAFADEVNPLRQFGQVNASARFYISDHFRLFSDLGLTWRFALDDKGGVPLYAKDGFSTNNREVYDIGSGSEMKDSIVVIPISIGYSFTEDPTFGELVTLRYAEVAGYCDLLIRTDNNTLGFSAGLSVQTSLSLIGLQEFPMTLKLGYDSLQNDFFWGIRFAVKR